MLRKDKSKISFRMLNCFCIFIVTMPAGHFYFTCNPVQWRKCWIISNRYSPAWVLMRFSSKRSCGRQSIRWLPMKFRNSEHGATPTLGINTRRFWIAVLCELSLELNRIHQIETLAAMSGFFYCPKLYTLVPCTVHFRKIDIRWQHKSG